MTMTKRSFEEASVVATGVQDFGARFGKRRRGNDYYEDCPKIAQWRCNLTGLSSRHNLYFIAYGHQLHVYIPQYPTQALSQEPALIVTSQPSSPALVGYLDPRNPHAINNLVVQFLGNEEVVAAVRDDGDVDAFLVRHIAQAIERRAEAGNSIGAEADEVRSIFQSNVGKSAWGLAIHTEARIIAVSANTHNITVFKFGLVEPAEHDAANDEESSEAAQDREFDVTHQVINGTSNIPCIAFCNTGDDPEGKWLLTTDIGGFCRAISLDTMQAANTFRFGKALSYLTSHDPNNSGWAIMFLDRRSFLPENSFQGALGLQDGESLPGVKDHPAVWDIGSTVSHVPDNGGTLWTRPRGMRRSEEHGTVAIASPNARPESEHQSESSPELHGEEAVAVEQTYDDILAEVVAEGEEIADPEAEEEYDSDSGESTYYAELHFDDEDDEDSTLFNDRQRSRKAFGNEPRASRLDASIGGDLPCPILHGSVRNVYLLQPANRRGLLDPFGQPTVGLTNALHQLVQGQFAWLNHFERLNMSCYLPAIGIVVLASQKGRAMMLSLTSLSRTARSSADMPAITASSKDTIYAMRIERILPLAQQEAQMERPFAPLHGISAGPIQGTEHLPDEQKRWRLMMMYADHSILSYEISRRPTRDSAIDLRGVIV